MQGRPRSQNSKSSTKAINVKPPHCKKCTHLVRGHKKGKNRLCPMCPQGVCASEGKEIKCKCDWHHTGFVKGRESPMCDEDNATVLVVGNVTEIVFPRHLSQSGLLGWGASTTSCTVISTIACSSVLRGEMSFPEDFASFQEVAKAYKDIMAKGNKLYDVISARAQQILLPVEEVIAYSELQVYMPSGMIPVADVSNLASHLFALRDLHGTFACVLICPPDKSVAICLKDGVICLMDSHYHHMNGAAISFCKISYLPEMCGYLEEFLQKYFNSSVKGSNLVPLQVFYTQENVE